MASLSTPAVRILRRTQTRVPFSTPPMPLPAVAAVPEGPVGARVLAVGGESRTPTPAPAPAAPSAAPRLTRVQLVEHAAARHAFTLLCQRATTPYQFRTTSGQLLVVLALEAMRSTPLREVTVQADKRSCTLAELAKPVVLLSVTRDGLSLTHNLLGCVPGVTVGSVSIDRAGPGGAPQARLHLASAPALSECRVILFDPVVQSGASVALAANLVRQLGATDLSLVAFTIASAGLEPLQATGTDLSIWCAHLDSEWDAKRNSASLLGDLGQRLFS